MSLASSRPRVRGVSGTALSAGAVGAIAVGALIRACLNSLDSDERGSVAIALTRTESDQASIPPAAVVRQQLVAAQRARLHAAASSSLTSAHAVRAATLSALAKTGCVVEHAAVHESLECLLAARSAESAVHAARTLIDAAESSHHQVFVNTLIAACQAAAIRVGLDCVEVERAVDGTHRMIASNDLGRALVTEITTSPDMSVGMESEVIGGDGGCTEVMDAFDRALEDQGVVSDQPRRRRTGGVCDLAVAKAFVTRRYLARARPAALGLTGGASEADARRQQTRQRGNRQRRQETQR